MVSITDKNRYCQRCGNCCRGMIWKKKFSFDRANEVAKGTKDKKQAEEKLIAYYKKHLIRTGLPIERVHPVNWDKRNKVVRVYISVGRCRHLSFTEDNKAICLNYKNRPSECRGYLCKKAKEKMKKDNTIRNEKIRLKEKSFQTEVS
ncbi:hypothetical protein GF336_00125 [Candidatus Woesearchaeota archaeon]|nr:hypothetical protein [Candidatus Woesearchaeota archaeon]